MRVKAVIAYDGSAYRGFQRQNSTPKTITTAIEKALHSLQIDSPIVGSGRTDARVHAIGQVIHFETEVEPGTYVMFNPPYGERIDLGVNDFYEKVGTTLKHKYEGCSIWIISSDIENMKFIGLRPSRKIRVMNGKLDCSFRKFEVYEGSKKAKKQIES
jgi:tRNA U38,U39,U40 pseudouridine synthase TruA